MGNELVAKLVCLLTESFDSGLLVVPSQEPFAQILVRYSVPDDITYRTYYKWLPKESRSEIDELDGAQIERNLSATGNKKGVSLDG